MPRISKISQSPPAAVADMLHRLGRDIRAGRLQRKLSMEELADRIGISRFVMADIENGKPTTAIAAYLGALWALGLPTDLQKVAAEPNPKQAGKTSPDVPVAPQQKRPPQLQIHLR